MHVRRLERLIAVLRGVIADEKPFSLYEWMIVPDDPRKKLGSWSGPSVCGTVCCAIGYGALDSVLQDDGLHLVVVNAFSRELGKIFSMEDYSEFAKSGLAAAFEAVIPKFGEHDGFEAVQDFFELSKDDAHLLFMATEYPSDTEPQDVIYRIEAFIRGG